MLYPALLLLQTAAAPAATDIYLAPLRVQEGRIVVGAPVNVTARPGYDNQPFFLPSGHAFLYTSIHADGQADIYRYDLDRKTSVRVTATRESEYSPTPLPKGAGFSVVRVEADSTQRLWAFDADGTHPRLVLDSVKPVGYYAWGDDHTIVLFVLGTPSTLQIADDRFPDAGGAVITRNVGRSLQRVPGRDAVSFVQRDSARGNWLEEVDIRARRVTRLVQAPEGADFFVWTPSGIVLTASGTTLYQWNPQGRADWVTVGDLGPAGLTSVSRLAVSPQGDRLAIVAVPVAR